VAKEKADVMDIFGLTVNQSRLLFSIEKYLVSKDIDKSKKDKDAAFLALKRFEDSIVALSEYMNDLNPKIKKEKTEIQKLKKSILYMKNTVEYIRKNI
jgi:peptidoglycan hydrolase CwlO-like protein